MRCRVCVPSSVISIFFPPEREIAKAQIEILVGNSGNRSVSGDGRREMASSSLESLDQLPTALLCSIMTMLDISAIRSLAATCKTFNACASRILSFLPNFHLLDISLPMELIRPLLPPNPYLRSLKLDCSQLNDSATELLLRPSLHDLCLHNCADFSGKLLSEIGGRCKELRSLYLGSVAEKRGRAVHISDLEELLNGCN